MRLGWGSRQVLALSALAVVLRNHLGALRDRNVLASTERAATEAGYVTDTVERTILLLNQRNPQADLATLAADPQIGQVLASGLAHAPSLLGIAVTDPEGIAVAHGIPQMIGQPIGTLPELPRPTGFSDAMPLRGTQGHAELRK
ncbi:MAG: hypothetical protein IPK72_22100 [Candidatus Eisenbacteria bacterium]|nr:hypothetical protein [Candidatus Eisenbacteria bacterium]